MSPNDSTRPVAFRATVIHCLHDPGEGNDPGAMECFDDGLLVVGNGRILDLGPAPDLLASLPPQVAVEDHRGKLLLPGFIDTHVHYPQLDVIASYGEQLLSWLERYTFPTEAEFADPAHARAMATVFLDEMLRNGTTSALVFATVHADSADAILDAARLRGLRLIAGKVLMDRHCPENLRDTARSGYRDSRALIERWHGVDRLGYAITPRFAPTSTDLQLELAGQLAREFPDVHVQTHVAENHEEVGWVAELFPWSRSYLDVYDHFGLLRERSVFAHCIHLDAADRGRMAEAGAAAAFCPTSNLFLGSGLFDVRVTRGAGIRVGLATDVGGGTSMSMLRTLSEAYKVCQLSGQRLSPSRMLYLATLGGAEALYLQDRIGNLKPGREADFVILDPAATPLSARRDARSLSPADRLFALFMLGDDRHVHATYAGGNRVA